MARAREYTAVVAGVVALGAGLAMLGTSVSHMRRNWYEVFFAAHHLYILFLLLWVYHVLWTVHFFSIPVILFIVDRFLRFLQSRHAVTVLSARVMDSGAMELRFPRNSLSDGAAGASSASSSLRPDYQALSCWYVKFPGLPKFLGHQWHALSVMSSPKDGKAEISIVIKPLGGWTNSLQHQLTSRGEPNRAVKCPFSLKAGVEGPYGDESDFYLKYRTLVLVAGGIGVTPLVAVLKDVLHRYRLQKQRATKDPNLPKTIELYHCVRSAEELCVLNSVDPHQILPDYNHLGLDITIHAFVTSPTTEGASKENRILDLSTLGGRSSQPSAKRVYLEFGGDSGLKGISPVSPTGETTWVCSVALASILGFYVLWGLTNVLVIKDLEGDFPNYSRAHLLVGCMLLGTGVFGGAVIAAWHYRGVLLRWRFGAGAKVTGPESPDRELEIMDEEVVGDGSPWPGTVCFGRRPVWSEVFGGLARRCRGQKVGVLVSGSQSMVQDVALQCKQRTSLNLTTLLEGSPHSGNVVFDFHTVSFEL